MFQKTAFLLLISLLLIGGALCFLPLAASAQDDSVLEGETEVSASDLGMSESGFFSWLGDQWRNIRILIARDPIKKSELQLEKASRELIKIRDRVKNHADDQQLQERLEQMTNNYQETIDRINQRIEEFKQNKPEAASQLSNFLDKYTEQQLKHQEILKKLEGQVPEQALEIIKQNRERHLEKFGEVMNRLQSKEEFKERIQTRLENEGENIQNRVREMEVLDELQQMAGQEIRENINELKQERQELFQELKSQQQKLQQTRVRLMEQAPVN